MQRYEKFLECAILFARFNKKLPIYGPPIPEELKPRRLKTSDKAHAWALRRVSSRLEGPAFFLSFVIYSHSRTFALKTKIRLLCI